MERDHYAILGVPPDADADALKRAYRRLTLLYHPDRNVGDAATASRFAEVSLAYDTLSDPVRRAAYDRARTLSALTLPRSPSDLAQRVFGDVWGRKRKQRRRGRDVRYTLTLSFRDAALGVAQDIAFEGAVMCNVCAGQGSSQAPQTCKLCSGRGEVRGPGPLGAYQSCGRCDGTGLLVDAPCEACRGRGTQRAQRRFSVHIGAGSLSGQERVLPGQGEPGRFGGEPGDLRVTLAVTPDALLQRDEDDDLRCDLPVSVTLAALGGPTGVPGLRGVLEVTLPPGVQTGTVLRLRGQGVPRRTGGAGDLRVRVVVEVPHVDPHSAAAQTLARLHRELGEDALPKCRAFAEALARLVAPSSSTT